MAYGPDPSQFGELYLPARIPLATVVVIHGGYWVDGFVAEAMQPMCRALQADGYAVWNLEYRRIGGGGGWPMTFETSRPASTTSPPSTPSTPPMCAWSATPRGPRSRCGRPRAATPRPGDRPPSRSPAASRWPASST